jgi:hypothetical protein
MNIFKKQQKKWEVKIQDFQTMQLIEICKPLGCSNVVPIFDEVMKALLSKYPFIFASQVIDSIELSSREFVNLLLLAIRNHEISMEITKSITDSTTVNEYEELFALHIMSNNSVNWIPSLLRFGTFSLPHIGYCYNEFKEINNFESLCKKNLEFINWFQFSGSEDQITKIFEEPSLIYWVADFRLYFLCAKNISNWNVRKINEIGDKYNLQITIQHKS